MSTLKENLKQFITDIENQSVILRKVDFKSSDEVEGIFSEGIVNRKFTISGVEIGFGFIEGKRKAPVISLFYDGHIEDRVESLNKVLVRINFSYGIKLYLKKDSYFMHLPEEEKREVVKVFAKHSGKLIIFPYIRYLAHMLSMEAGLVLPPLKPLLIRSEEKK